MNQADIVIDEKELINQASSGDLDAFNQLVLRYQDMAYNHTYALLNEGTLAEDAVQETFIHAFRAMDGFRGGSFRAWLLKIATNTSYDLLRQMRRRPAQPLLPEDSYGEEIEEPAWLADPAALVETAVEQKEDLKHLHQILDELPENYRSVITLIDVYEFRYAEAAHILKVSVGTIKSRLARARLQMQEKLQIARTYRARIAV